MGLPLEKEEHYYTGEDYYALPEGVRAELIDGVFYDMATPSRIHQRLISILNTMIFNYIEKKGGDCQVYPAPFAVKLRDDRENYLEPDISVICDPSKLTDEGCTGAPDWILEIISPSSQGHDYIRKLSLYLDAGVREYWIVDPLKERVIVYVTDETDYNVAEYSFNDSIKVAIYEDLIIDLKAVTSAL